MYAAFIHRRDNTARARLLVAERTQLLAEMLPCGASSAAIASGLGFCNRKAVTVQATGLRFRRFLIHCGGNSFEISGEYLDSGISGAKSSRPELDRLMADAHLRRFDAVIVWKFDRFARSVSHLLRALETFQALGIEFVSLSEQLDTSTPTGKMVFTVLGAVAELERSLIAERVKAGLRNAKAKGKRLGRRPVTANPAEVQALRSAGKSFAQIAATFNISQGTAFNLARGSNAAA
jgi:DNA invertase Pin-like site-specific DNA recombinase